MKGLPNKPLQPIKGPFKSENDFKAAVLSHWLAFVRHVEIFEIENQEKEPGMPDVLIFPHQAQVAVPTLKPGLVEFKISDANSVIRFQKSQPLFYKKYPNVLIYIVAWDVPRNRLVQISAEEILANKSLTYKLPEVLDENKAAC